MSILEWCSNYNMIPTSTFLQDLDPTFSGTRECKFLAVSLNCSILEIKRVAYVQHVKFSTFIPMNRTLLLLSMKKTLQSSQTL